MRTSVIRTRAIIGIGAAALALAACGGGYGSDESSPATDGPDQAAAISQPVLSVLGTETDRWFVDSRELLRCWLPQVENCTIEGVAHLLHMQCPEPVAQGVAEFFARHPITRD